MMMETRRPLVAEIKRNSLDDGPGIRSVVFFKGCPLRCVWCHNPECIDPGPEILFRSDQCMGCGSCAGVCPEQAVSLQGPAARDREKCVLCGACADECPSASLSLIGKYYRAGALAASLARDKAFYDNSGGGVTLSGGEPTLFMDYVSDLARHLKEMGIEVLLETCGDFPWEPFRRKLLPHIDRIFVDIKLFEKDLHKKHTGRDNERIRKNIVRLIGLNRVDILVRVPLVPDITASRENLEALAAWLWGEGLRRIALLPYNPVWIAKARGLGKPLRYDRDKWMSREDRDEVRGIFRDFEIEREI